MYEQLRTDFQNSLMANGFIEQEKVNLILHSLDQIANKYSVTIKPTELVPYLDELPEMAKIFLVVKKMQGYAETTLAGYKRLLETFFFRVRKNPQDITSTDVRLFLFNYQIDRNVSMQTLERYRCNLRAFFKWSLNEGYIQHNPTASIEEIKFEKKQREALSVIELERLRSVCDTLQEKAIMEYLYSNGCRVSEISHTQIKDINWDKKTVHIFGKGSKHRISFINPKAEIAIKDYLQTRDDDSPYLFVSNKKPHTKLSTRWYEMLFNDLSVRAFGEDGRKVTLHVIRHTTATIALQRGMPVTDIQLLLGHSNINTTMIYAQASLENVAMEHKKYIV